VTAKSKVKESGVTTEDVAGVIAPGVEAAPVDEYDMDIVPDEYEADVERLAELEREIAELRDKLAEASVILAPKPRKPSFGLSEGTREELARTGKATDPHTGEKLTRDDLK
jgi:hypothetical protein